MPLRLILFFVIVMPLAGIVQVENGAFAGNVAVWGYRNGASYAFAVYGLCALGSAWVVTKGAIFAAPKAIPMAQTSAMRTASLRANVVALIVNGLFFGVTLFLFGGISVLSGDVGKGEFRSTLGGLGAFAYLTSKWFSPSLFAFACAMYCFAGRPRSARLSLVLVGLVTFLTGLSWGFKTSGIFIVLPGFVILLWSAPVRKIVYFVILGFGAVLLAFSLFDTLEGTMYGGVLEFLLARLTVFTGDVSWYLWDMWINNAALPDYAPTLLVGIGDRLYSLFTGITPADSERWVLGHYSSMLTYMVGYPIEGIEAGHNVTGTPFSEGIIAAGAVGILIFGLAAGAITGFVFLRITRALRRRNPVVLALWCTYAVSYLFAWLNGGEIVQLIHISVIVGAALCWVFLSAIYGLFRATPRPRRVAVLQAPT